jgi:hypothetical protein
MTVELSFGCLVKNDDLPVSCVYSHLNRPGFPGGSNK